MSFTLTSICQEAQECVTNEVPTNSECENATVIDTLPFDTDGSLARATREEYWIPDENCYFLSNGYTTVWYSIDLGNNETECLTASLRFDNYEYALLGALVGSSCGELECVGSNEGSSSTLSLKLEPGETYYLVVAQYSPSFSSGYELQLTVRVPGLVSGSLAKSISPRFRNLHASKMTFARAPQ